VSDDTPTGRPGDRQPLPKFPWEEGYVAPTAENADTPTERFDAQAAANPAQRQPAQPQQPAQPAPFDPDQPTELFDVQGAQSPQNPTPQNPAPQQPAPQQPAPTERFTTQPPPNLPTFIPQEAAPPINPEPTERFDALPSDDPFAAGGLFAPDAFVDHSDDLIPTERFVAAEPTYSAGTTTAYPTRGSGGSGGAGSGGRRAATPPKKSNALLWTLVSIAGVLLTTIIVLAIILLQPKGTPTPVDSATAEAPIEEPEPEATEPEEEPEATGPVFDSFTAPETSGCVEGATESPLEFSWESTNAVRAYIGVGTDNARDDPFDGDLPPTYTYLNIVYLCEQESQTYTVTLEDENGEIASETVSVSR